METIRKIIIADNGKKFYVRDLDKDFHTQYGYIKASDLKKKGKIVTNTGKELFIFEASFIDCYRKIKRMPQIITLKDLGVIIAETGVNSKSKLVDAGAGSGALACFLANIVKEVVSYELRNDFFKVADYNRKLLGLKNLKLKNRDIYKGIAEKNVDLITLDLPEPWKAIEHADKSLKVGGFLVSYSPTVPQVMDFVKGLNGKNNLFHIKTIEIIQREWDVKERVVRPKTSIINHTGFLTFVRKISV